MINTPPPILEFDQVHYTYPGQDHLALDGISLQLPAGKRIAVLGQNGSGKSTLFLHANGILQPDAGTVHFDGSPLSHRRADLHELRRQVGVVFQHADEQLFSASVAQDISFGPLNLGLTEAEARTRVAEVADLCGLTDLLDRPTHALSGGEKARAALAGVLAMRPDVLLIDEPTASLDPPMRRQIFTIFQQLHTQGKTIVLATHELAVARHWADLLVVMHQGQVLAVDSPQVILADGELMQRTGLDVDWWVG